jgi:hypothetical protein
MRSLALVLLLVTSPALADIARPRPAPEEKKPAPKPKAEVKFPLPKDAGAAEAAPGGGGKIVTHQVPRGRDAVVAEVRELLKKDGWQVTRDDKSPSGRAVRIEVKKSETLIKASFTGDDARTVIILTLP